MLIGSMTRPQILTSPANPLLKEVRRANARGSTTQDGYLLAEGFHLLEEALRSKCEVKAVLATPAVESRLRGLTGPRVFVLDDRLFETVSSTEATQGVLALVRPPAWNLDELFRGQPLVVVLDGIQDPGNAGAIIRAAEAFGDRKSVV